MDRRPGGRGGWNLSLAYGPRKRKLRIILAYVLPLVLVVGGVVYGIWHEKRKADVVFDALETRLRTEGGPAPPRVLAAIQSVAGSENRIHIDVYDIGTSALIASNARKNAREGGMIELRFQRRIRPFGRDWLVRQLRRTPTRNVLLAPETFIWLAIVFSPIALLARGQHRRSFELGPTMLDSLVDVIVVVDAIGRLVYVSPSISRTLGYIGEEVLGQKWMGFVHPDDAARLPEALEATKSAEATVASARVRAKSGEWHHVEGTGRRIIVRKRVIGTLVTVHDITAVVSAKEALWVSEERFRRLFESIRDYSISTTDLKGHVVSWNTGSQRMTGYTEQEIVGRSFSMLYPEEKRDEETLATELHVVVERESVETEEWLVRKDGSRFLAQIIRSPLRDRVGRLSGFCSIMRDITERRMIDEQVSQAQRLDSLGKLAGGIAHDFNNMLMVIFSRAELLSRTTRDRERHWVEDIQAAAKKSRDLTQQLLAAARRQVLQPVVVNLNDVVTSTLRLLRSSIGEDIEIRMQFEPSLWSIYADPGKLHQVLMNLALNARDAMPDGGRLAVETRNFHAEPSYVRQHPQLPQGEHVQLVVSDSGQGIPPEIQQRIYDPFFSTKGSGTGLGLAVVRGIVEQTGGQIWVYSEVGKGTTFRIFFPRFLEEAAEAGTAEIESAAVGGTETILVVEDEELLREIIRETLEEQGYEVLEAASADDALARSAAHDGPIDLLLTDVVLPGMNGRLLAQQLSSSRPQMRVLFMSGYTDNVIARHGVLEPGERFVEKPTPASVLLRTVRQVLDGMPHRGE